MTSQITKVLALLTLVSCSNVKLLSEVKRKNNPNVTISVEDQKADDWFNEAVLKEDPTPSKPISKRFLKNRPSKAVSFWIDYFSRKQKKRYERYINNGIRYKKEIESIFAQHGLPKELFFVGLIESGYYIGAKSRASAVGPWQFIKPTAQRYGLKINSYVDERKEILKSTEAAAKHFKKLFGMFGSWELALAAYNQGENGLRRRIRKYRTNNFYELSRRRIIPKETRHYIPKVLAAMHVYKNANNYRVHIPKYKRPYYEGTKEIEIKNVNSLKKVARKLKTTVRQIKKMNPDLIGWYTPYTRRSKYVMRVPRSTTAYKEDKNFRRPAIRGFDHDYRKKSYTKYKVKRGDNLSRIAGRFKTDIRTLKKTNRMKSSRIYVGQKIKVPGKIYKVRKGDYLIRIANKHKMTAQQIMAVNDLKSTKVYPGQKLVIR